jgi:galactose mutarotase-like enzyme
MANLLEIREDSLQVFVAPDHGGMIAQICLDGLELLKLDAGALDITPMSAGGIPVLFPFPSKTTGDCYTLKGRTYSMPVHGLVKNSTFALREHTANKIVLWRDGCSAEKEANYPFDYELELEYKIENGALLMCARILNKSQEPLPHYIGWHPYFKATDKKSLRFEYSMSKHYNYIKCIDESAPVSLDLSQHLDDVFHTPTDHQFSMENPTDGYSAQCILDDLHQALVICSWIDGAICIEPWCGIPNSINNGRFLRMVQPGQTQACCLEWHFKRI